MANRSVRFPSDGKIKIMHITDTHLDNDNIDRSVWLIGKSLDREKPDIAIITGDNVSNSGDKAQTKVFIEKLMSVFEERNIPAAVTFGNHDSECKGCFTRDELMNEYRKFSCTVIADNGFDCGTYNVPVLSSDGEKVRFNLWVLDSGSYDDEGHYANLSEDKVKWYSERSAELKNANGGECVYSLAFQHTIVPEVYEALKKVSGHKLFSFPHMYNKNDYYMFDPAVKNYGTFNETPCCGFYNHGHFSAMVENGDVLGIFTGHDHINAFGVQYKGIDIVNSLSTRYNGDRFSTQYGYRMIFVNENNTADYTSRVEHWYDMFSAEDIASLKASGDTFGFETAKMVRFQGVGRKIFEKIIRTFTRVVTGRVVTYPER